MKLVAIDSPFDTEPSARSLLQGMRRGAHVSLNAEQERDEGPPEIWGLVAGRVKRRCKTCDRRYVPTGDENHKLCPRCVNEKKLGPAGDVDDLQWEPWQPTPEELAANDVILQRLWEADHAR